jgi:hypothetical protein
MRRGVPCGAPAVSPAGHGPRDPRLSHGATVNMAPARNVEPAIMTTPIVIEISRNGNRIAAPSQPPASQAPSPRA